MNPSGPIDTGDALLQAALARATRRFPPPRLPADLEAARAAGPAALLAFCLEQARLAAAVPADACAPPSGDPWGRPFTEALAALLAHATRAAPATRAGRRA